MANHNGKFSHFVTITIWNIFDPFCKEFDTLGLFGKFVGYKAREKLENSTIFPSKEESFQKIVENHRLKFEFVGKNNLCEKLIKQQSCSECFFSFAQFIHFWISNKFGEKTYFKAFFYNGILELMNFQIYLYFLFIVFGIILHDSSPFSTFLLEFHNLKAFLEVPGVSISIFLLWCYNLKAFLKAPGASIKSFQIFWIVSSHIQDQC